jgi:hypothetical protein
MKLEFAGFYKNINVLETAGFCMYPTTTLLDAVLHGFNSVCIPQIFLAEIYFNITLLSSNIGYHL